VRKQYYFRPTNGVFDAWDVEHLAQLSADLPVKEVPLSSIVDVDSAYWFGANGSPPTFRSLVSHMEQVMEADLSFPVIIGADGQVMDGMHRIAKSLLEGRSCVRAVQFEQQPSPDYTNVRPEDLPYE
jgi:uncharacterized membrane protein